MESSIGERMKSLRVERGMTLAELAEQVNLSTSYLSQIERDRTMPSLSTLVDIAQGLKVEPRYFFNRVMIQSLCGELARRCNPISATRR